jgi:DNA invertase Pin-like site-specific DNA recombinase
MINKTLPEPSLRTGPRLIGYMRVSRSKQRTARQEDALAAAKCWKIYCDKISGKKWKRVGLEAALSATRQGDKLVVDAIDRLGRSALEILTVIAQLHRRGASLLSLSQGCDSLTENGYVQCLFHAVFAEIEHVHITRRTRDGVNAAAARGANRGAKPKLTPKQIERARRRSDGGEKVEELAREMKVGRSTLYRWLGGSMILAHEAK